MLDLLDKKLRQMHASLAGLGNTDLTTIQVEIAHSDGNQFTSVDFNQNSDSIALANAASLLIANIASLKDHLKAWCKKQNIVFSGDTLINTNQSVAIVHDLWNLDKHAELNSASRSGLNPKLGPLTTALSISTGTAAGASAFFSMDPRTGQITTGSSGGGEVVLSLVAEVFDGNGNVVGDFQKICTEAIDAWSTTLTIAGVPIP